MKTVNSGNPVSRGVYLSLKPPDISFVGNDGEVLEGPPGARYARIPTILALLASPALGGLFVVLFPVLVFAAVITLLGKVVAQSLGKTLRQQAPLLRMQGTPAVSYLKRDEEEGETEEVTDDLIELEEEIREAREEEGEDR